MFGFAVKDRESGEDVTIPVLRHFVVFNADQIEGLPQDEVAKPVFEPQPDSRPAQAYITYPEQTTKGSSRGEPQVAHYKYPTYSFIEPCSRDDTGFQESVGRPSVGKQAKPSTGQPSSASVSSGLEHVTLRMALSSPTGRLCGRITRRGRLPLTSADW